MCVYVYIPWFVVDILSNWYSKLFCAVRWNNRLSVTFSVGSVMRQGSVISPAIFKLMFYE